jgi:ABC-type transport system substrate-binding protein
VVPLPLEGTEALLPEAFQTDLAKAQERWNASGVGDATVELAYASDGIGRGGVNLTTLATKLQSDLEKIDGLTLKLVPLPSSQRSTIYRAGEFQATLASWLPDYPGVDSFVTPFFRTDASTAKRVNYSNPEMDEMIAVAAAELDPEEREQMYLDIQRKGLAEAPYIMLYQPNDIKVANRQVEGVQVHAAYSLQLRQARKNS